MRLTLLVVLLIGMRSASAYPIFQFTTGNDRCSDCHFNPSGGGLINAFGRSENGSTISWTGNGELLHGAWTPPDALALGADLRFAGLAIDRARDDNDELAAFPMQADAQVHVESGALSFGVTAGLNGAARNRPDGGRLGTWLVSREHYVMYQKAPGSPYVKLGRFFPALGVRTPDHSALERRALDAYTLQEPYALGGGTTGDTWELHASLFAPNPYGAGPQPYGATAYFERLFSGAALVGQARVARTADDTRALVGVIAKKWLPRARVLLIAELDAQLQAIAGTDVSRTQLLAYAAAHYVLLPGLAAGLVAQRWDPDLGLGGTARTTTDLHLQVFAIAHLELYLLGRFGWSGALTSGRDSVGLVQVHYWL